MTGAEDKVTNFSEGSAVSVLESLSVTSGGLSEKEATLRQRKSGLNLIHKNRTGILTIFLRQFTTNPLIIILTLATIFSYLLDQHISSYYIFGMILLSVGLGFWNEYSAGRTIDLLLKKISLAALVIRNGEKTEIPVSHLTVGDIVLLSQGSIIPADLRLLVTKNLEVNESSLTGETKTVFKTSEAINSSPAEELGIGNIGYMGTVVESGSAEGVVIRIGKNTRFGKIAEIASFVRPQTEFQKGLSNFGSLILRVIIIMTITIFAVNVFLGRQLIDSLLFSLAIAVGLTPELLPVIVTVSLSHGAGKLAKKHLIIKQLIAIENLGNMDILCTDKTGTITEGKISVVNCLDQNGNNNDEILKLSILCNSAIVHHKVIGNAIDVSLWEYAQSKNLPPLLGFNKLFEEPFDYIRKAMFSVVANEGKTMLIAKGAPDNIINFCKSITDKEKLQKTLADLNAEGLRMIAVATKQISPKSEYAWKDIRDLDFRGYITFLDVPKQSAKNALDRLALLNVQTKIITGDNEIITEKICRDTGITVGNILLGSDIEKMSDQILSSKLDSTNIFARMTPDLKLRVITALQVAGHTVGYLGDGINDLPALHGADVGISVNTAVDVAKDSASVVLLRKSLNVIADGIFEGRKTFNNTLKYILMATSSNFGNMFSAAGASFFLPFLPMTPAQILLTNGLYDISQFSIPSDNVDSESLLKPKHWNINFIKNYMIFFGPLSSIFDFTTFAIMIYFFNAKGALFQTGWFIESIATQILVVFVIRTSRTPFFRSLPGKWLIATCLTMVAIAFILPFSPFGPHLGLVIPPPEYFIFLIVQVACYLVLVEAVKNIFLKKYRL